ncbi:alpha/beta hydrolase [Candidatus Pelagibacter sp.]|nr:alpha/beta hydrolase [Candidatus Pelagibacter sp.]
MKKIILILTLLLTLTTNSFSEMILKSGFYDKNMNLHKTQTEDNIDDPENKIILIYNSGQDHHDIPRSNLKDCTNTIDIFALATLVSTKINNKEIMLYILCTQKLAGDDENLWNKKKFKEPYKGTTKLDKAANLNLKLIDNFVKIGIPVNQIFLTGHSCGAWMTFMLMAKHPNKVAGGIVTMPACYGKLTENTKVKKIGVKKGLEKFRKKNGDGPANLRQNQINEIKKSKNLPILVFTHPEDPFDGLLSDWMDDIPGVKRIILETKGKKGNYKLNKQKCRVHERQDGKITKHKARDAHDLAFTDCFQFYNPTILKYIESRI